jgi:hypothetical protein
MLDVPVQPFASTSAAAASSCSVPDGVPRIVKLVPPLFTEAMRSRHKAGIVDVTVSLDSNGTVVRAVVSRSAGDALLDGATYAAAIASTYAPEVKGCRYLTGDYVFRARYRADPTAASGHPAVQSAPTEAPPFPPQPQATPAPLTLPADAGDIETTVSPAGLATAYPAHRGIPSGENPLPPRPVRVVPGTILPRPAAPTPGPSATPSP